jgi:hypothetical protein
MSDLLEKISTVVNALKKSRLQDEDLFDTIVRLTEVKPQPDVKSQQPQPQTEVKTQPQAEIKQQLEKFKFKPFDQIKKAMENQLGSQWYTLLCHNPGILESIAGDFPPDQTTQNEMKKIYTSYDEKSIGSAIYQGQSFLFFRSMIEPV